MKRKYLRSITISVATLVSCILLLSACTPDINPNVQEGSSLTDGEKAAGSDVYADGDVEVQASALLPEEAHEPEIIISYDDNGGLMVCARGERFIDCLKETGFEVRFYDNEEQLSSDTGHVAATGVHRESDQRNNTFAYTVRIEKIDEASNMIHNDPVEIDPEHESARLTKDSAVFKIPDADFGGFVKDCRYVQAVKQNMSSDEMDVICSFELSACIKEHDPEKGFAIIPEEFITSEYDKEFFMPETEMFRIVEVDIPDCRYPWTGFYSDQYGYIYFGYDYNDHANYSSDVRVIYMVSYDDFGPVKGRAKIVYEDDKSANQAWYCYPDFSMLEAAGTNAKDEDYINSHWSEITGFNESHFFAEHTRYDMKERGIQYNGRHGDARYFTYEIPDDEEKNGGYLIELPFTAYWMSPYVTQEIDNLENALIFIKGEVTDNGNARMGFDIKTWSSFETSFIDPYRPANNTQEVLDLMMKRGGDDTYFKPVTDDYLYVIRGIDTNCEVSSDYEDDYLISYNDEGEIVQYVVRRIDGYFASDYFDPAADEYYSSRPGAVFDGDVLYDDLLKSDEIGTKSEGEFINIKGYEIAGLEMYPDECVAYYASKPTENISNTLVNVLSPDDFSIDELVSVRTDDYSLRQMDYDGSYYYGMTRVEELVGFDANGNPIQTAELIIFKNEAGAQTYHDDMVSAGFGDDFELDGNKLIIYAFKNDRGEEILADFAGQKTYFTDMDSLYLSKPYYTYAQYKQHIDKNR